MGTPSVEINQGTLRSVNVAQARDRTRLVLAFAGIPRQLPIEIHSQQFFDEITLLAIQRRQLLPDGRGLSGRSIHQIKGLPEREFVKIFQIQKNFDDQFEQAFDLTDDTSAGIKAQAQQAAQAALEQEIKKVLGNDRYLEYQRAQDGDYRALLQIADRYQLDREVANQVYNMKVASERQKLQVETTPNLTDQQRAQMLASIAQQTERNVASTLGADVYKSYSRQLGQWLNDLYFFDESNLPPESAPSLPQLPPVPPGLINSLPPGYRELLLNTPGALPPIPR